jgi:hypothetical protein
MRLDDSQTSPRSSETDRSPGTGLGDERDSTTTAPSPSPARTLPDVEDLEAQGKKSQLATSEEFKPVIE